MSEVIYTAIVWVLYAGLGFLSVVDIIFVLASIVYSVYAILASEKDFEIIAKEWMIRTVGLLNLAVLVPTFITVGVLYGLLWVVNNL